MSASLNGQIYFDTLHYLHFQKSTKLKLRYAYLVLKISML